MEKKREKKGVKATNCSSRDSTPPGVRAFNRFQRRRSCELGESIVELCWGKGGGVLNEGGGQRGKDKK